MRRTAASLGCLAVLLAACATPEIRLAARFSEGMVRTYRLVTEATTVADVADRRFQERVRLIARSTLEVLDAIPEGTLVRLTLTPERLTVDGASRTAPAAQSADLVIAPDGGVVRVAAFGGLPPEVTGADVGDLISLIGAPLPTGPVHVGERWQREVPPPEGAPGTRGPASEDGRVRALRGVLGYDCAIVSLGASRGIVRQRTLGGQPVRLEGNEVSSSEIAFAFREGLPVHIDTRARAELSLQAPTFRGGRVDIRTRSTLSLTSVTGSGTPV